jgi:tellurite resistance protein TerC
LLGGLLIVSAAKMLVIRHDNLRPNRNVAVRMARRRWPITKKLYGNRFFVHESGLRAATPLFLTLLLIGTSNVIFAIDSIPAVFSVTRDPFLIFTSNIFAILGLRSLYFAVAGMMHRFRYLKMSLVFLLAFAGVQMMLTVHYAIPGLASLAIICGILGVGIMASVFAAPHDTAKLESPLVDDLEHLLILTYREARRVVVLVVGMTVVLLGILMLALPAPGTLTIILGLTILAFEFAWARKWLKKVRAMADSVQDRVRRAFDSSENKE